MAKVFRNYGIEQRGGPFCILPWLKCVELLELDEFSRTEERPKFGEISTWPIVFCYVVRLENPEAQERGVQPGYFESPVTPEGAGARFNQHLGREAG
jgi:hypothetical protein